MEENTMRMLSILIVLIAVNGRPAAAEQITIGHMPVINQSEVVTEHLGLYKKYGLDVQLKLFPTGPTALQGLLSGDLQMVEAGGAPMLNLAAQNLPLYFLVSGGINSPKHPAGSIMIRPDDQSIKSFSDLKGKKVGQLGKATITYFWLYNAAARYGIARNDFQEIFVPFPQMGGLLASKQVDAIYAWPPFDTIIAQAGQGRILMDDTEFNPYAVINAMIVRKDWADKNPRLVSGLIKAAIESGRWINDHQSEAREIIGKKRNLSEPVYKAMRMFHFPRNGYQVMPSIWDSYFLMIKAGEYQPFSNPKAVFDKYWIEPAQKFIAPALDELGREKDPIIEEVLKIKLPNLPGPLEQYLAPWERR
jgi:ABC-type nitrate/sulfonate/bicarbonate transport system substrate-binding protein